MDFIKLREYAILLDVAIHDNMNLSKDVEFLANYQPLMTAITDAKAGKVESPRDLGGLGRWLLESNIRDFPVLSDRLSGFRLLLRGLDLPPEHDAV